MVTEIVSIVHFHIQIGKISELAQTGRWKECSVIYRNSYLFAIEESELQEYRYWCLSGFCSIFMEEQSLATSDDLLVIKAISKHSENIWEIGESLFALGLIHFLSRERERSVQYYRSALKLKIQPNERSIKILNGMMRETSAGEILDDIIRRVDRNLRMMSGEHIVVEERFPEGVEILGMKREVAIRSTTVVDCCKVNVARYLQESMRISGDKCDMCGVSSTAQLKLSKCKRFVF